MKLESGSIAVVTGAGSGIGRAVSLALNSAGFAVALAGRRAAELDKTASLAPRSGVKMLPVPTDVSKPDSVQALFARVAEEFGRLDVNLSRCIGDVGDLGVIWLSVFGCGRGAGQRQYGRSNG